MREGRQLFIRIDSCGCRGGRIEHGMPAL